MADLFAAAYNPDVLTCLANLSNDEVFTPPELANQVLDMLPKELWSDANATFLDPCCKSGVFLREIAKRLIVGLADQFPDLQERVDHIFQKQLFGIAITELTSLLSRRSLYCSKWPNGKYSVTRFESAEGNLRFRERQHTWVNGRCSFCGASKKELGDGREGLETHAYEFIHLKKPEELFNMKFDVIVGNPPYQLSTSSESRQAKPIYHLFVQQAMKLNPRYLTMIIPSRWFAGGMGLDSFREAMANDKRIKKVFDFANAKECFPQNSISGGVCYFLWAREGSGQCEFYTCSKGEASSTTRALNEWPVVVRYNNAVSIVRKVSAMREATLSSIASSISPFGIKTSVRGSEQPTGANRTRLLSSKGFSWIGEQEVKQGKEFRKGYKVALSQTGAEHACEPDKSGQYRVLTSSMCVLSPLDVCTHSYIVLGSYSTADEANNLLVYLKTRFARFLVLQAVSSIHISKGTFIFVPIQDFSKPWTDEELYAKYGLTDEEIAFIESMIKPMDLGDSNA